MTYKLTVLKALVFNSFFVLAVLRRHCRKGLSQMEWNFKYFEDPTHLKFSKYFKRMTTPEINLPSSQKDLVAVIFSGSPFNQVKP